MSQMITEEDKAKRLLFAKTLLEGPEELLLRLIFSAILRTNECQDIIRRLHASFRGRLEKCVAAQGGHTNY